MSMQQVNEYDEDLQLALALSASEAEAAKRYKPSARGRGTGSSTARGGPGAQPGRLTSGSKRPLQPSSDAEQPGPSKRRAGNGSQGSAGRAGGSSRVPGASATADTLASDEAVAKALQEEYDVEPRQRNFHPRCQVCRNPLPEGVGGIECTVSTFWREQYCPCHDHDGTKRCYACSRLQPQGAEWADLGDGRWLCTGCLATLVPDTKECQPLYDEVLQFYASMGMKLPARPPMMLVDMGALNEAEEHESLRQGRPVFHYRACGMCFSEYSHNIVPAGPVRLPGGIRGGWGPLWGLLPGFSVPPPPVQQGPPQLYITALMVLYGFPRLLTGSILAHEVMHAWLRMTGYGCNLAREVEEGLCQLMALLWLEKERPPKGSFEERLASFFAHQIRTFQDPVYGDGFRAAHDSFQRHGLKAVLAHVKQTGRLPF